MSSGRDNDSDSPDLTYVEAAKKMAEGSSAVRIGAKYIADFYRELLKEGIPDELARDLTEEFAKEVVNPKVHANSGGIIQ